uniref:Uncharacterized protein n=1 Tax=Glossina austeni TaxID=7395 RepID=A0A1A9VW44_GLOAU
MVDLDIPVIGNKGLHVASYLSNLYDEKCDICAEKHQMYSGHPQQYLFSEHRPMVGRGTERSLDRIDPPESIVTKRGKQTCKLKKGIYENQHNSKSLTVKRNKSSISLLAMV